MTLNHDRLEMIGRIEAVRRQLGAATTLILNGASSKAVQDSLGVSTSQLADARNELLHMEDFNV